MTNAAANTEGTAKNAAERTTVEAGGEASPDVTKALAHVENIVANVLKHVGGNVAGSTEDTEKGKKAMKPPVDPNEPDEDDMPKAKKGTTMRAEMKKALGGVDDASFDAAMTLLKAAGLDPDEKFQNKQPPVTKAADAPATQEAVAAMVLEQLQVGVAKAKAFTPDRVAKLKAAVEALKMLLDDVGMGNVPATSTPPLKTSPGSEVAAVGTEGDPVTKALTELAKGLEVLTNKVSSLDGEVRSVKSARPAPEGQQESGTTVKTEKAGGIWKGIV